MEQARSLMWAKRKQGLSSNLQVAKSKRSAYDNNSWEEEAFAEDTSGSLGGCTWPPRSYSCSFCRREFLSAQALGGHMNVHRRDRARLKQSSSPINPNNNIEILNQNNYLHTNISSTTSPSTNISIATPASACKENYCDYKKALCLPAAAYNSFSNLVQEHPRLIRSTVSSSSTQSWSNMDESDRYYYQDAGEKTSKLLIMESEGNKVKGNCCETSLSLVVCKEEGCNNKRRKIDLPSSSMSSFLKPSPVHTTFIDQPDKLFEVNPLNSLEELDLELRLGDRPKLKY